MSNTPDDLMYTKDHEWIRDEGNGIVAVGVTDHAQGLLGDLVFVELPEVGASLESGAECAVVESVKAASDVYSPLNGEVTAVNDALGDTPETINEDPYGDGWIFKMKVADAAEMDELLDAAGYIEVVTAEE